MLDTGEIVAGYRVDGLLGEGGMGAVYRATQLSLNRTIALKVLSAEFGDDPGFRERFRREGQLQAALDHPHIVTVYEAGETEHGLFLAMRLVRGSTLKDLVLAKELDVDRVLTILAPVADALDSAHDVGLIHRDVKPQNILVGARDHAYLADFGLTKTSGEGGLTETGQFIGTIDYVAPEQIQGEQATAQSDVYSLAGVLYECLSGEVPFARPTEAAVLFSHISEPPPKLSEKRADLPAAMDDVIAKGMAKIPAERHASPTELMRDAAAALGKGGAIPAAAPEQAEDAGAGVTAASATPGGRTAAASTRLAGAGAPTAPAVAQPGAATAPPPTAPVAVRRRPPLALLAVAAVAGLAAVGYLAGSSGSSDEGEGADFPSSASAGSVGLAFPSSWERVSGEPAVPGLELSDAIVLAPASGRGQLAAGTVAAAGPNLLPASFTRLLPSAPGEGDPVRLGEVQAYRYEGLRPRGLDGSVTLYTAPTSGGVATIACTAPGQGGEPPEECEAVATTLELSGVKAFPLGPSESYAKALAGALRRLGSARRSGEAALRRAGTQSAQAAAAERLATAYTGASSALARVDVSPADQRANDQIVAALRAVGGSYRRAAAAARTGNDGGFSAAAGGVRRAGQRLQRAISALEALGYSVS